MATSSIPELVTTSPKCPDGSQKLIDGSFMDVAEIIRSLRDYLAQVNFTIAELEKVQKTLSPERRGRKSMGVDERRLVSKRMKQYWASRQKTKKRRSDSQVAPTP